MRAVQTSIWYERFAVKDSIIQYINQKTRSYRKNDESLDFSHTSVLDSGNGYHNLFQDSIIFWTAFQSSNEHPPNQVQEK